MPYSKLVPGGSWHLLPKTERELIEKLERTCRRLDDPKVSAGVFVGIQTSADDVYHLKRLGQNQYLCQPKKKKGEKKAPPPYEVEIEDAVMKPLVSGPEAKRYQEPQTDTYLLFPYAKRKDGKIGLLSARDFETQFPRAWKYLKSYESKLRERENNNFNDDEWYRFGRYQNLDKQEIPKLIVAQTVPDLRVCFDDSASFYLNNVRVNGIVASKIDPWYLLAALNAPVCNFIFHRIAAPKAGGYFEANKQYIAPLPIPTGSTNQERIATLAQESQQNHTERRRLLELINDRLARFGTSRRPDEWIFPDVGNVELWLAQAPHGMMTTEKITWAKNKRKSIFDNHLERIESHFVQGAELTCKLEDGELRLYIEGQVVIDGVYVQKSEQDFIFAQWDVLARTFKISEKTKAKSLVGSLQKLVSGQNPGVVEQVINLHKQLSNLDADIARLEDEVNKLLYKAYNLTPNEIALVERG